MKLNQALVFAAALLATSPSSRAQNVTSSELLHPAPDTWPLYHGDYSGQRHSSLKQITPENIGKLSLAWAFQTGQGDAIKSTPLLVDGVLYFTVPNDIWAVDARSGHQLWHYRTGPREGLHIGHRGVGIYKSWLYFTTSDGHLVSLNAKDGTVRWEVVIADVSKG